MKSKFYRPRRQEFFKYRVNWRIRATEVRVISDDGQQLGILPTKEAMRIAEEKGLDLIEVAPNAKPPVAKILDLGKFKYQEKKREAQAKKKQTVIELKEVKFSPKTDVHDIDFKVKHILRFLGEGDRVKLTVFFRGRQMAFKEKGFELLDKVMARLGDVAKRDDEPRFEGRRLIMNISSAQPVSKKKPDGNKSSAKKPEKQRKPDAQDALHADEKPLSSEDHKDTEKNTDKNTDKDTDKDSLEPESEHNQSAGENHA